MPVAGEAPEGVDKPLWDEVGWLPGPVDTLSEFTRPESAAVVRWLAGVVADAAPCHRALTGVDHYFLVAAQGAEPTHVVWGTSRREDVERCATTLRLGGEARVTRQGALTRVATDGGEMWLLWMRLGEATVVVADRARARVEEFLPPPGGGLGGGHQSRAPRTRLGDDAALVEALTHADRDADTWSVSRDDITSAVLGEAARMHAFSILGLAGDRPDLFVRAWARFADEPAARRSKEALDALVKRTGPAPPGYAASVDGATVTASARLHSMADLAALRPPASTPAP